MTGGVQRFRKKPVVVEAIRYIPGVTCDAIAEWTSTYHEATLCGPSAPWPIETLGGVMEASPGDWIIKGVKGGFYPVADSIFREIYEPVEES